MEYEVERQSRSKHYFDFIGYIDGEYAGMISGYPSISGKTFDIQYTTLVQKYQGTKAVRAFREIIKGVEKYYNTIRSRIDSKDNDEIKIVLSAGFHIIGTVSHNGEIAVELLKTKENS